MRTLLDRPGGHRAQHLLVGQSVIGPWALPPTTDGSTPWVPRDEKSRVQYGSKTCSAKGSDAAQIF